ncbi:MAG: response regulator [Lachnospiraceae bacterium]|nr:response regulator [Lachnospiraceae bacterium]
MENGMFDENIRMNHILYDAKVGLWSIEIEEGRPERMYADRAMLELLGLDGIPTPEECFIHWHSRIEKSALGLVQKAIDTMARGQHGEVSYGWHHPKAGKTYVRCGGTLDQDYAEGLRFRGYHQDISEMVSLKKETEQLRSFNESMLASLKDLYFSVMMLNIDKGKVYPLHLTKEGETVFSEETGLDTAVWNMVRHYHPQDREQLQKEISLENLQQQLERGKRKFIREYRRKIEGEYRWVSFTCYFITKTPKDRRVLIAIQDIDEQKKQEKEYQKYLENRYEGNMEILRMSLKNTNIFEYFYYPKEGKILLPEKTARHYGCKEEYLDIKHDFARDLVDPEYYELFCRVHEFIREGGKNDYFYYSARQGKFWCKCSISSVRFNEWGNTVFAVGIIEDLTRQRAMELENERYQSLYKFTVDSEYEGIGIIDVNSGNTEVKIAKHVNPRRTISQGDFEEIKTRFIDLFICREDREFFQDRVTLQGILQRLEQTREAVQYYFTGNEEYGSRHKLVTVRYFNEKHTKLFVCVRDIEQQTQMEADNKAALQKAFESAEQANRAKSEFLSKMSHDIRTPMNAIVGMSAIAEANIDDQERVLDCLNKIKIASHHLTNLVNEVLDMSRIESGKMNLVIEDFDLAELVEEVMTISQTKAEEKQQRLTLNMKIKNRKVMGDNLSLQKVFHNILGNAVKYTQIGGQVQFQVEELSSLHQNYGYYRFTIADNGFGMSEEFQQKLFEPFERSGDPRVESIEGTGLGMPIAYNLIQLMQGDIQVESELNKGSKFIITLFLPLQSEEEEKQEDRRDEAETTASFPGRRVLLVEDNELNIEIAMEILKMFELEVTLASNGKEAVETYQSREAGWFDIVFMDIQMPVMDGYAAAKAIRDSGRKDAGSIPIVAMTANAFSEDVQKAIHTGMNDHLAKPIDIQLLVKILTKWLS